MNCNLIRVNSKEKLQISYGYSKSHVGNCFLAWTDQGICFLAFGDLDAVSQAISDIKNSWPDSKLTENNTQSESLILKIFSSSSKHNLVVSGTDFQIRVWKELLNTKFGDKVSYEALASRIGGKNYTRASASAIARNNISYLIPCHRVIRKSGDINKYRWGTKYKKALLEYEEKNC